MMPGTIRNIIGPALSLLVRGLAEGSITVSMSLYAAGISSQEGPAGPHAAGDDRLLRCDGAPFPAVSVDDQRLGHSSVPRIARLLMRAIRRSADCRIAGLLTPSAGGVNSRSGSVSSGKDCGAMLPSEETARVVAYAVPTDCPIFDARGRWIAVPGTSCPEVGCFILRILAGS